MFTENDSKQEAISRSNNNDFWAACLKNLGKLIGNIYLSKQNFDTWELGYVFNMNYQGCGYAAEALLDDIFSNQNSLSCCRDV